MVFRTMSPDEIRYWYTEELSEARAKRAQTFAGYTDAAKRGPL